MSTAGGHERFAPSASGTGIGEFARREEERRRRKIALCDAIAERRPEWTEKRRRYYGHQLERLVCTFVAPGSRVLEVGCGLGDLLAALPASLAVGIDLSPRMIALARERHPRLD